MQTLAQNHVVVLGWGGGRGMAYVVTILYELARLWHLALQSWRSPMRSCLRHLCRTFS
jgi:hypothetical protein